jgi:hypothetical protein
MLDHLEAHSRSLGWTALAFTLVVTVQIPYQDFIEWTPEVDWYLFFCPSMLYHRLTSVTYYCIQIHDCCLSDPPQPGSAQKLTNERLFPLSKTTILVLFLARVFIPNSGSIGRMALPPKHTSTMSQIDTQSTKRDEMLLAVWWPEEKASKMSLEGEASQYLQSIIAERENEHETGTWIRWHASVQSGVVWAWGGILRMCVLWKFMIRVTYAQLEPSKRKKKSVSLLLI